MFLESRDTYFVHSYSGVPAHGRKVAAGPSCGSQPSCLCLIEKRNLTYEYERRNVYDVPCLLPLCFTEPVATLAGSTHKLAWRQLSRYQTQHLGETVHRCLGQDSAKARQRVTVLADVVNASAMQPAPMVPSQTLQIRVKGHRTSIAELQRPLTYHNLTHNPRYAKVKDRTELVCGSRLFTIAWLSEVASKTGASASFFPRVPLDPIRVSGRPSGNPTFAVLL